MKNLSEHTIETPMGFIPKGLSSDEPSKGPALPEDFGEFDNFRDMMLLYTCAIREVNTKLENLDAELELTAERNPIQYITHRVKTPASIMKKMRRMGVPLTFQNVWDNLNDVAGVRVVCSYLEDIYELADVLLKQDDIRLIKRKDYIKNPKPSGYRSLHLVIETPVFLSEQKHMVRVEIQIRTIAMDFWASLEHQLRYKTDVEIPDSIRHDLTDIADDMFKTDLKMSQISRRIQRISRVKHEAQELAKKAKAAESGKAGADGADAGNGGSGQ